MDAHRLAEARSLAYHALIATRLSADTRILERARRKVGEWRAEPAAASYFAEQWNAILALPVPEIVDFLTDDGELATELRQSSPFAGVLTPEERWAIWRRTKLDADR